VKVGAFDSLLRVRNELHFLSGKNDTLSSALQETVAVNLGFVGVDPTGGVDRLVTQYALSANEIQLFCRQVVARVLGKK
jgi:UTP:GlnB (protein PII) uridylyltransferase